MMAEMHMALHLGIPTAKLTQACLGVPHSSILAMLQMRRGNWGNWDNLGIIIHISL